MKDSEDASRLDRDVMGGEATVARRHIRVKARRGPGCLLMAIFQGDLYVGGCREHSGPFLVWHEAFSWTLDQLAARPEADKAPPSHRTRVNRRSWDGGALSASGLAASCSREAQPSPPQPLKPGSRKSPKPVSAPPGGQSPGQVADQGQQVVVGWRGLVCLGSRR